MDFLKNWTFNFLKDKYIWLLDSSYYLFIIVCLIGLTMQFAGIKKGKSLAGGSIILYIFLKVIEVSL